MLAVFLLALCGASGARAQEVRYLDLVGLPQRTALRYPPTPPAECTKDGCGVTGFSSGVAIGDGAPDIRDPHALGVYLVRAAPTEEKPGSALRVECKVQNTGTRPIDIPVFPHLSDLQPADASTEFTYLSLTLVLSPQNPPSPLTSNPLAMLELYGTTDRPGTILTLQPGEWLRVRAEVPLRVTVEQETSVQVQGDFWLRQITFQAQPAASHTNIRNLYPNTTPTPSLELRLLPASKTAGAPGK